MQSHFLHLLLYSTLVSAYFGAVARRRAVQQIRLAAILWIVMVGGALLLACIMFPFPR